MIDCVASLNRTHLISNFIVLPVMEVLKHFILGRALQFAGGLNSDPSLSATPLLKGIAIKIAHIEFIEFMLCLSTKWKWTIANKFIENLGAIIAPDMSDVVCVNVTLTSFSALSTLVVGGCREGPLGPKLSITVPKRIMAAPFQNTANTG